MTDSCDAHVVGHAHGRVARAHRAVRQAPGASVVGAWPLVGGITSSVDACVVQMQSGARVTVVLRRWRDRVEGPDAADRVHREAGTLRQLAGTGVPAPELVAVDRDGECNSGQPSLLMTRVPGQVDLQPKDPQRWLQQLAGVLPVIHEAVVQAPPFRLWMDVAKLSVPDWSARQALWRRSTSSTTDRAEPSGGKLRMRSTGEPPVR